MKKHDRALKAKGFHQVSPKADRAIVTKSILTNKKGVAVRMIERGWWKPKKYIKHPGAQTGVWE